jgi:hypothetical protein
MSTFGLIQSEERPKRLPAEDRAVIVKMFEDARQQPGFDFDYWVEAIAANLCCSEQQVRQVVAKSNRTYEAHRRLAAATWAQKEADTIGACQIAALETLRDGLNATKKTLLVNKDRYPILNDKKEPQFVETPDWAARIRSSIALLEVHGAKAPRQIEVSGQITHTHKSEAQLIGELASIMDDMKRQGLDLVLDVKPVDAAALPAPAKESGE